MKVIPLQHKELKDKVALVDDEDFEELSKYTWKLMITRRKKIYAFRRKLKIDGDINSGVTVLMHRQLMNFPTMMCDHIDGDTLNNQKYNLRLATGSGNSINSKQRKKVYQENEWLPRGISFNSKYDLPFTARICINRKRHRLGAFKTLEEATKAYNDAAQKYHGEFRRITNH